MLLNILTLFYTLREGAIIMPFKRPRYTQPETAPTVQPASKRPRIGASSTTGPSPGSISKYSADSNSKLYRMIAENFPDGSKKLLSMAYRHKIMP